MKELTLKQIADWCGGKVSARFEHLRVSRMQSDSRKVRSGDLFVALKGAKADGHDFAETAINHGAVAALVSRPISEKLPSIEVEDTLRAYGEIAAGYRKLTGVKVVGITGSVGKTTTKEMTASVLEAAYHTAKTEGNHNNNLGLPMTIMDMPENTEVAVLEMGMNHSGELAPLCEMTRPKIGIITSIGTSHMEYLGSRENIAREKCTLARCLPEDGFMIFPADCDYADMIRQSTRAACIDCGIGAGTVRAENPVSTENGTRFILSIPDFCREEVELPVHGRHMVTNALLAAAAGWAAGLAKEQIASGLNQARLTGGRLHCTRINGILVVDDTYNANPDSMQAALHTVAGLSCTGRRFAVLGRMGELGAFSEEGHVLVGRTAEELRLDCVVSVGTDAARITDAISPNAFTQSLHFGSAEEAAEWLRSHTAPGDIVLFKGSRLARMEQVMNLTFPPQ